MPRTKGTKQLFVEVTDTLLDEFKAFCKSRVETVRENLEMAMRRHMANPPPPPPPPIPVSPPPLVPLPPVAHASGGGWAFTDRRAYHNGKLIKVSDSRLQLLRVLVEADDHRSCEELTKLAFGSGTDTANTRYHIRELRQELKEAFGIEGNPIPGEGKGYRLFL